MQTLTQVDTLALWESGRTLHPIDQGLLAVETAFPETRDESVADWPLGRRNRALAELHCACFGSRLSGWTTCRECGEKLEFNVDGNALLHTEAPALADAVIIGDRQFRLPTSRDLARIASSTETVDPARALLNACLVAGDVAGDWSEEEIAAAGEQLAAADPLAEVRLDFKCPACGEDFEENLDLASFLWLELQARAERLLLDVHLLARAYGWSEAEVLALSPVRRNFYLEMVQA
jgi:hypothetical protein